MARFVCILLLFLGPVVAGCKGKATAPTLPVQTGSVQLISNLSGMTNADISFSNDQGRSVAVGFTTPSQAYTLNSVALKLRTFQEGANGLVVRLFDNNAQNNPGTALLTFINPAIESNSGAKDFTFTPPGFTLAANTTYWIVAYYTGAGAPGWVSGNPSTTPTGIATHFGAKFDLFVLPNPPTTSTDQIGEYAVMGTPVATP